MFCEFIDYIGDEWDRYYAYCTVKKAIVNANDCDNTCQYKIAAIRERDEENDDEL